MGDLHKIFSDQQTMAKVNEGCRSAGIGCIECKGGRRMRWCKLLESDARAAARNSKTIRGWRGIFLRTARRRHATAAGETMENVRAVMGMSLEYEAPKVAESK